MLLVSSAPKADSKYVEMAKAFANEKLAGGAEIWEREKRQPVGLLREAIGMFTPLMVPQSDGGVGASKMTVVRVLEELAKVDYGFTFALAVHNNVTFAVSKFPEQSLRGRYLPKLMSGEMIGAFLLTEPSAGSDAGGIATTAEKQGGSWVLNGEKIWVTNAATADFLLTFARTGEGPTGVAGFALERTLAGVECTEQYDMIGAHAMVTGTIKLSNCQVAGENMGFPPEIGLKSALGAIDVARLGVAAMNNGVFAGCLELSAEYVKTRKQFGKPLMANQGISFPLADALTELEASRLLTFQAANAMDEGIHAGIAVTHAKKYATRVTHAGITTAMEAMGANGLKREYPLVRQLAAMTIAFDTDGTNNICNVVLGKRAL